MSFSLQERAKVPNLALKKKKLMLRKLKKQMQRNDKKRQFRKSHYFYSGKEIHIMSIITKGTDFQPLLRKAIYYLIIPVSLFAVSVNAQRKPFKPQNQKGNQAC
jgi:hypothetical protein